MLTEIGFLSTGERYEVRLPDGMDPEPDMRAVIALDGGGRELVYEPRSRRGDPDRDPLFKRVFEVISRGIRVSVYLRRQDPPYAAAFWRMPGGFLNTFIDDDAECGADLVAGIKQVIPNVRVRSTKAGPAVDVRAPVTLGDPRDPFERDITTFRPNSRRRIESFGVGDWPVIALQREPEWAHEGTAVTREGEVAEASVTNARHIRVGAVGPHERVDELQKHAEEVAASLVPAG
jgi:hypothetical protein